MTRYFLNFFGAVFMAIILAGCPPTDDDGDGHETPEDCDDSDSATYPGAEELCDQKDNNCDGATDEGLTTALWFHDTDGDGFGTQETENRACGASDPTWVQWRGDCDDDNSAIHPGAQDVLGDSIDSDCGGTDSQEPCARIDTANASCEYDEMYDLLKLSDYTNVTFWVGEGAEKNYGKTWQLHGVRMAAVNPNINATVIDGSNASPEGALNYILSLKNNEGPEDMVDGFTFVGSVSDPAIIMNNASPSITQCYFHDNGNAGYDGGALNITNGSPTIKRCYFARNYTLWGGAISMGSGGHPVITDSYFEENHSRDTGGAIRIWDGGASVVQCDFRNNRSDTGGGAIAVMFSSDEVQISNSYFEGNQAYSGGAIHLEITSSVLIDNSRFRLNQAELYGGGIDINNDSSGTFFDLRFEGNSAWRGGGITTSGMVEAWNLAIIGNRAMDAGGGIYSLNSRNAFSNIIVQDNSAARGGGYCGVGDNTSIEFATIVGNVNDPASGAVYFDDMYNHEVGRYVGSSIIAMNVGYQVYVTAEYISDIPPLNVEYSDLYSETGLHTNVPDYIYGSHNINQDPLFVAYSADDNPANDDLHLSSGSPCINAGDPADTDADGTRADMGAYGGPGGW